MDTTQTSATQSSKRKSRRRKTFTGCWDCRTRKVKCDEIIPECTPCRRRGFKCSGYQPVLVWVASDQKKYERGRRRVLKSCLTWQGHEIYDSSSVDDLVAKCDASSPGLTCLDISAGPFTVFALCTEWVPSPRLPPSDVHGLLDQGRYWQRRDHAAFLFHHYLSYVSHNMMPFGDPRNPWQSFYPLMARCGTSPGQRSLLNAMLAQAAGNLAHLGLNESLMSTLSVGYYALAIEDLRKTLEDSSKDFSLVLAIVLTLIMAEVYNGKSKAWRLHLKGAWEFISFYQEKEPWHQSDEAWLTAQSFCLLRIRCDTMEKRANFFHISPILDSTNWLMLSVSSRAEFGFTVGASPGLMSAIIETTELASKVSQQSFESYQESAIDLYHRLRTCSSAPISPTDDLAHLHHRIFQLGAIIYFHRSIFNSSPRVLDSYLDQILQHLKEYRKICGGHVTLWPIFMAAVEAHAEHHQSGFRDWLDDSQRMGAASRKDIKEVIEAVWEKRLSLKQQHLDAGVQLGDIVVDWREVMPETGLDILLI